MSIATIFEDYAQAFDETYEDDNWSRLEAYFTADAIYLPGDGQEICGRTEILAFFRESVEELDRRFDLRIPVFTAPLITDNQTTVSWSVTYQKTGVPDLVASGIEKAIFRNTLICHLEDLIDEGIPEMIQAWFSKHEKCLT